MRGNCRWIRGDCTGLSGNCSGLSGDLNDIPLDQRKEFPNLTDWIEE
jgi:hypothetical protein